MMMKNEPNGLLYINKPQNLSSQQAINPIKWLLKKAGYKKVRIGHFGTLDPFADGLLIVALGHCTRFADYVHRECPKTYLAHGIFGEKRSTGDREGEIIETQNLPSNLDQLAIEKKFQGEYWQKPPHYSATKFQGKALYEWAREGELIEKEPVKREIYHLSVEELKPQKISFKTTVSSGTYIRVLMEDIAQSLMSVGYLEELSRLQIGSVSVEHAISIPENIEDIWKYLRPPTEILTYPHVQLLDAKEEDFICHGRELERPDLADQSHVWVFGRDSELFGLGQVLGRKLKIVVNMKAVN